MSHFSQSDHDTSIEQLLAEREQDSVQTANKLLDHLGIPIRITSLDDCTPALWVTLFEGLFETRLSGIDRRPSARPVDKERNVELVIYTLQEKILRQDLSHISAIQVCKRNWLQVVDLLEIFGLLLQLDVESRRRGQGKLCEQFRIEEEEEDRSEIPNQSSSERHPPQSSNTRSTDINDYSDRKDQGNDNIRTTDGNGTTGSSSAGNYGIVQTELGSGSGGTGDSGALPQHQNFEDVTMPSTIIAEGEDIDDERDFYDDVDDIGEDQACQENNHSGKSTGQHTEQEKSTTSAPSTSTSESVPSVSSHREPITPQRRTGSSVGNTSIRSDMTPRQRTMDEIEDFIRRQRNVSNHRSPEPHNAPFERNSMQNVEVPATEFDEDEEEGSSVWEGEEQEEGQLTFENEGNSKRVHWGTANFETPVRAQPSKSPAQTPPVLQPSPSDTPHTRVLKRRRAQLLREARARNILSEDVLEEAQRLVSIESLRLAALRNGILPTASPYVSPRRGHGFKDSAGKARRMNSDSGVKMLDNRSKKSSGKKNDGSSLGARNPKSSSAGNYNRNASGSQTKQSQRKNSPDRTLEGNRRGNIKRVLDEEDLNLLPYVKVVKDVFPGISVPFPRHLANKMWRQVVETRRKIQDRTAREREVQENRAITNLMVSQAAMGEELLERDLERERRLTSRRAEIAEQRAAQTAIAEKNRRVARLTKRQQEAEQDAMAADTRRKAKEEKIMKDLYAHMLQEQNCAARELEKYERDIKNTFGEHENRRKEAKENYYRDQVKMLEDQVKQSRQAQSMAAKAQADLLRQIQREQKSAARTSIKNSRERLSVDGSDLSFRERDAQDARRRIRLHPSLG